MLVVLVESIFVPPPLYHTVSIIVTCEKAEAEPKIAVDKHHHLSTTAHPVIYRSTIEISTMHSFSYFLKVNNSAIIGE